jgi:hypothetical protein
MATGGDGSKYLTEEMTMTEDDFYKLPMEERRNMPIEQLNEIFMKTHDDMVEVLTIEGWEYVGPNDKFPEWEAEVWRREINGVVEWCEIFADRDEAPPLEPERCWGLAPYPLDPRLIED